MEKHLHQTRIRQRTDLQNIQRTQEIGHQKITKSIKKWSTDLNRELSTEESKMPERHLRKCSTSLVIREMQIKTTLRFHLTPVRMANIKNIDDNLCWRGCGEKGTLLHCWWECKLVQSLDVSVMISLGNNLPHTQ